MLLLLQLNGIVQTRYRNFLEPITVNILQVPSEIRKITFIRHKLLEIILITTNNILVTLPDHPEIRQQHIR